MVITPPVFDFTRPDSCARWITTRLATGLPPVVVGLPARTDTTVPGGASAEVAAERSEYTNLVLEFVSNVCERARPSRSVRVEPVKSVNQPAAPNWCRRLAILCPPRCAAATVT